MKKYKNIFSRHDDINKMAFITWRMDEENIVNLFNLADGYFISTQKLCNELIMNNQDKKADIVIFPILMLFNHGVELYLKGLIMTLNNQIGNNRKLDGTHNLSQLFNVLCARIKDLEGQKESNKFIDANNNLKSYIEELMMKIEPTNKNDKMDFPRYPFTKKDGNHFYVDTRSNIEIDLVNLRERTIEIIRNLEQYADYFYFGRVDQQFYY